MAEIHPKKQQIAAGLAEDRIQLEKEILLLRRNLDVRWYCLASIRNHPWEWTSSAAILGWLLSRLPARKKRVYVYSSNPDQVRRRGSGLLGNVWKAAWNISKPLIAAYLAKQL